MTAKKQSQPQQPVEAQPVEAPAPMPEQPMPQMQQPYPQQPYMQQPQQPAYQQPQYAPQPAPQPQSQQPVAQQPQMQQPYPQQPMQYVMMQQSLKGVGGWLIFWIVLFSLGAIAYITIFFASMLALSTPVGVIGLIFAPILAGGYITSVVMIAMQKRLAKLITWITIGASAIYAIVHSIVVFALVKDVTDTIRDYSYYSSSEPAGSVPMLIASILVSLVIHALVALYFIFSRRVKETLVN